MLNRHKVNHKSGSPSGGNAQPFDIAAFQVGLVPPYDAESGADGGYLNEELCMLVQTNLSAFQDDELDPEQRRIIAAHVNDCPNCTQVFEAMQETDWLLEREWRDEASLPSSSERRQSIDAIMNALPPVPSETPAFAPKRIHSKARWMRFATGLSGLVLLAGGSYRVGYLQGQASLSASTVSSTTSAAYSTPSSSPLLLSASLREPETPPRTDPSHTLSSRTPETVFQERSR
jgi:hypothetical protein